MEDRSSSPVKACLIAPSFSSSPSEQNASRLTTKVSSSTSASSSSSINLSILITNPTNINHLYQKRAIHTLLPVTNALVHTEQQTLPTFVQDSRCHRRSVRSIPMTSGGAPVVVLAGGCGVVAVVGGWAVELFWLLLELSILLLLL